MKEPEYNEGPKALETFEQGMKALFKVSKDSVVKAAKKAKGKRDRLSSLRKPKRSDKD